MTTAAKIGIGTYVDVRAGTATDSAWTRLGEVVSITPPSDSVDQIEVTHMESPNRTKEFIAGLSDPGTMSLEMNYVVSGTTDDFIIAWRASGETRDVRISHNNTAASTDVFPAFVLGYTPQIPVGDKMSAGLELKVAGAVVRTN